MAARLVGAGFGRPDAPEVYEVPYASLPDWLAARRLLEPDWQAVASRSAAAVAAAVPALPPDAVAAVAAAPPWTYGASSALLKALTDCTTTQRGLLGGLAGPAGTVEAAVRAWEKSGAAAAAAGLALAAAVDCEIPALRKAVARGHQAVRDLSRRAADGRKAAAAAAAAHADRCARAGLTPGVPVRAALAGLPAQELPAVLAAVAAHLRAPGVGEAMAFYAAFTAAMHGGGGGAGTTAALPALAALRAADVDGGGGGTPASLPTPDDAQGDDGDAAAWGITTVAGGQGGEGGGPAPSPPPLLAVPSCLATLADSAPARAALGDDIAELTAFLRQRAAEAGSSAAAAATAARHAPATPPLGDLDAWTVHLTAASTALSSDRTALLFGLRAGGRAADRFAADLEAGARVEARHREAASSADARCAAAQAALVEDASALVAAIQKVRAAKAEAEAAASARLGRGRRVVLVGPELEAVLAEKK